MPRFASQITVEQTPEGSERRWALLVHGTPFMYSDDLWFLWEIACEGCTTPEPAFREEEGLINIS